MHIGMTVHAGCFCFRKHQAFMAFPATQDLVLARKGHRGSVVVEGIDRFIEFPAVRAVTKITAKLKVLPVR